MSNSGNSDDLEWPSRSFVYCKPFQMWFFVQVCSSWQDFNWHGASRGPSAIAELLVSIVLLLLGLAETVSLGLGLGLRLLLGLELRLGCSYRNGRRVWYGLPVLYKHHTFVASTVRSMIKGAWYTIVCQFVLSVYLCEYNSITSTWGWWHYALVDGSQMRCDVTDMPEAVVTCFEVNQYVYVLIWWIRLRLLRAGGVTSWLMRKADVDDRCLVWRLSHAVHCALTRGLTSRSKCDKPGTTADAASNLQGRSCHIWKDTNILFAVTADRVSKLLSSESSSVNFLVINLSLEFILNVSLHYFLNCSRHFDS